MEKFFWKGMEILHARGWNKFPPYYGTELCMSYYFFGKIAKGHLQMRGFIYPPTKIYYSVKHLKSFIFFRFLLIYTCHVDHHVWQTCANKTIHVGAYPLVHCGSASMSICCWMWDNDFSQMWANNLSRHGQAATLDEWLEATWHQFEPSWPSRHVR
jgi:hypothetical protein